LPVIKSKNNNTGTKALVLYLTIAFIIGAFTPPVSSDIIDPWWNPQWYYRKEITIDHTKVSGDLTDFPIFIHLNDIDLSLKAQANGNDIVFTNKIGNKINHEIEYYNSTTGEIIAWVNIPFLSSSEDTVIYLYYGNQNCNNQQNIKETWNSNYVGVWHMKDTTPAIVNDSSAQNNNGIKKGSGEPSEISAKIGKGQEYDGTNDYVNAGNNAIFQMDRFTASLWIKPERLAWCNMIIGKYKSATLGEWYLSFSNTPPYDKLRALLIDSDGLYQGTESATSIPLDTWTHIDLV